ncbi:Sterile alpha motif (SAM) domain-containing protein [Euphorbia peplus]|nr:Sterile alpha motif (SAM) domain-containing protein [Euphorbia peplus]
MAAELQSPEFPFTGIPTSAATAIATNSTAVISPIEPDTTGAPPKRQRRPSVRLGEIGDQSAATLSYESHLPRAKQHWRSSKSVKARSITHLNGNDAVDVNGDVNLEFRHRKARRPTVKRVRSSWISKDGGVDGDGDDGDNGFRDDFDQSPINSTDMWQGNIRSRVSDDGLEIDNVPESGVRSWLIELGLSRYAPVFEVHEVDDEVLPLLTLEDLKDMGINAVGSRRKLYSAIQKLGKGFS